MEKSTGSQRNENTQNKTQYRTVIFDMVMIVATREIDK